jgi:PASTA domain
MDRHRRAANVAAVVVVVVMVGATALMVAYPRITPHGGELGRGRPEAHAPLRVPELHGLATTEARSVLEAKGLVLANVMPALGQPGIIIRTRPAAGTPVPPDASVTVYVGVEPGRLQLERAIISRATLRADRGPAGKSAPNSS